MSKLETVLLNISIIILVIAVMVNTYKNNQLIGRVQNLENIIVENSNEQ